jgi:hypothetical protein
MFQKYLLFLYKNLNEYHKLLDKNISLYNFSKINEIQIGGDSGIVDAFKHLFRKIQKDINKLIQSRDQYANNMKEYEDNAIIQVKIIKILVDLYNKAKSQHSVSDDEIDSILKDIYAKLNSLKLAELTEKIKQINSEFNDIL